MSGDVRPALRPAIRADLRRVFRWIPDRDACRRWAGPRVRYTRNPESLARQIGYRPNNSYVLTVGDTLVGFAQLLAPRPRARHLTRVLVAPDRRGAGFGRALCETLLARARRDGATRLSLYVYRDNPSALGLYEALGWRRRRPPRHPLPAGLCYMVNDLTNVAPAADPG
jgi:ribosomal protein S18 acetylase RimI-like enzyme